MSDGNGQQPPGFMEEIPEGTAIIRLLILPPHGEMKIEAHGLPVLEVQGKLAQAASSLDRELICIRMEERAAQKAAAISLARDLPRMPRL
jgi:hypothetical protein